MRRAADVPVLSEASASDERDERLKELTNVTVPALEAHLSEALVNLARSEARVAAEREAKTASRAEAAHAREAAQTARDSAALALAEAEARERGREGAAARVDELMSQCARLEEEVARWRARESAYSARENEVAVAAETHDVRVSLLEDQARLLTISLKAEEEKVGSRDEMLRALQQELSSVRKRNGDVEQRLSLAQHAASRAEGARRDAEAERDEMQEKLTLAMMEVCTLGRGMEPEGEAPEGEAPEGEAPEGEAPQRSR